MKRIRDPQLRGTRGAILAQLRRRDRTVADLARALGITPNGVRAQLDRLVADGFTEPRGQVPGVSKRFRVYGLAARGRRVFSRANELLLVELLSELVRRHSGRRVRTL